MERPFLKLSAVFFFFVKKRKYSAAQRSAIQNLYFFKQKGTNRPQNFENTDKTYSVTLPDVEGATITPDGAVAELDDGATVKFTVTVTDDAKELDKVTANGVALTADNDGNYTVTIDGANVTVVVTLKDKVVDPVITKAESKTAGVTAAYADGTITLSGELAAPKTGNTAEVTLTLTYTAADGETPAAWEITTTEVEAMTGLTATVEGTIEVAEEDAAPELALVKVGAEGEEADPAGITFKAAQDESGEAIANTWTISLDKNAAVTTTEDGKKVITFDVTLTGGWELPETITFGDKTLVESISIAQAKNAENDTVIAGQWTITLVLADSVNEISEEGFTFDVTATEATNVEP